MKYPRKKLESFRLDRSDSDRLRALAGKKGVQYTVLIRNAVVRMLDQESIAEQEKQSA